METRSVISCDPDLTWTDGGRTPNRIFFRKGQLGDVNPATKKDKPAETVDTGSLN